MPDEGKKTILIADDEEIICKPLSIFFERKGYFAITACDGEDAYQMLSTMKVDVMIADVKMPKIDGLKLIEKAKEKNPYLPIIILSGAGSIADATVAIKSGAFDYVQKPIIDMDDLERTVLRAIEVSDLEKNQRILQKNLEEKTKSLEEKVAELNQAKEQLEKHSFYLQRSLQMIEQQNIHMEEDLKSAQHIQEDLLPKDLPRGEHFCFASRYIPSGKVAGDMFDAFFDPTYNIHMYVADVAGHGVGAAMVTVFLKKTITPFQHFADMSTTPKEILNMINQEIIKAGFGRTKFVTMLYATYNPPTGTFTFSSAGHTPFILKSPGQEAQVFTTDGVSLGWQSTPAFHESSITLHHGDKVLFYTDGLTDALYKKNNEPVGLEKILSMINSEEYNQMPLEKMIDHILSSVKDCCEVEDDISLLAFSM